MNTCATCGMKMPEDQSLAQAIVKAKKDAEKYQTPMALYKDDYGEWQHENAFTTTHPLSKVVSFDRNTTPVQVY